MIKRTLMEVLEAHTAMYDAKANLEYKQRMGRQYTNELANLKIRVEEFKQVVKEYDEYIQSCISSRQPFHLSPQS